MPTIWKHIATKDKRNIWHSIWLYDYTCLGLYVFPFLFVCLLSDFYTKAMEQYEKNRLNNGQIRHKNLKICTSINRKQWTSKIIFRCCIKLMG